MAHFLQSYLQKTSMKHLYTFCLLITTTIYAQPVPAEVENIPFLVTFGNEADKSWGDDDFCQIWFFKVPPTHSDPFYIRVFDPGASGKYDERKDEYNSRFTYSIYGGKGTLSPDSKRPNPVGNYKAGNLLDSKTFSTEYDDGWYTFGPFNPTSGFLSRLYGGYVFKVICEGETGDDGNLYRYYLSSEADENVPVEGGNAFCFEYTFRLHDDPKEVSHVYPYIDNQTLAIKQGNFDWDYDGDLKFVSTVRMGVHLTKSGDGDWGKSSHEVLEKEKETSYDIQFHKNPTKPAKSNNISIYITNQRDESLAFYTVPIGGVPQASHTIKLRPK